MQILNVKLVMAENVNSLNLIFAGRFVKCQITYGRKCQMSNLFEQKCQIYFGKKMSNLFWPKCQKCYPLS